MKVTAAVYQQAAPTVAKPVRHFFGSDGNRYMEHEANFIYLRDVTGTYSECWDQAKAITRFPVLQFPVGMYKERDHVSS